MLMEETAQQAAKRIVRSATLYGLRTTRPARLIDLSGV